MASRVAEGSKNSGSRIDGQLPGGHAYDGTSGMQIWTQQTQPFSLPDASGVPNLLPASYKTYIGRDSQQLTEFFDGWIDELRVFNQLLDVTGNDHTYNLTDDNPNNISVSASHCFIVKVRPYS
ncbi:MAG: hypothetical protein IPL65_17030 [Lewinellaceae bacterium]|nr:hypothetical protein [Lewinellaceae bacterium]